MHFNTSNVTIQPFGIRSTRNKKTFQYIKCYYSTKKKSCATRWDAHFNTSNVTIQHVRNNATQEDFKNFNTSNVTIQPTILSHLFYSQFHYTHYISTFS